MSWRRSVFINFDNRYSHILIIGNGFDLNLGLKTSYTDFIKSEDFAQLLRNSSYLARDLQKHHDLKNWIDIENHLTKYSQNASVKQIADSYQNEFNSLSIALKDYLKKIEYVNFNKNSYAYKLIESIINANFLILDFNYTTTVKHILKELNVDDKDIDERLIKVHGSIEERQIIFGVEDGASIKDEHVFLRKAFNLDFKGISIKRPLDTLTNLFVFGHSLGETDYMYFKKFFLERSNEYNIDIRKRINLYYYGDIGYTQLFTRLDVLTAHQLTTFRQNNEINLINTFNYPINKTS
jgi:hypothetical protein